MSRGGALKEGRGAEDGRRASGGACSGQWAALGSARPRAPRPGPPMRGAAPRRRRRRRPRRGGPAGSPAVGWHSIESSAHSSSGRLARRARSIAPSSVAVRGEEAPAAWRSSCMGAEGAGRGGVELVWFGVCWGRGAGVCGAPQGRGCLPPCEPGASNESPPGPQGAALPPQPPPPRAPAPPPPPSPPPPHSSSDRYPSTTTKGSASSDSLASSAASDASSASSWGKIRGGGARARVWAPACARVSPVARAGARARAFAKPRRGPGPLQPYEIEPRQRAVSAPKPPRRFRVSGFGFRPLGSPSQAHREALPLGLLLPVLVTHHAIVKGRLPPQGAPPRRGGGRAAGGREGGGA